MKFSSQFISLLAVSLTRTNAFISPQSPSTSSLISSGSGTSTTELKVNLASELILSELTERANNDARQKEENNNKKKDKAKLSRPERKALERERKAQRKNSNHRRHNYGDRASTLESHQSKGEGRYDLHSTAVSSLNKDTSSADDVMKAIKRAQNLHDIHDIRAIKRFLLEEVDDGFAFGYKGSLLARLAVAALHMGHHGLASQAMQERKVNHRAAMLPLESAAIIRGLLRVHNVTDAFAVLNDELSMPLEVSLDR